MTPTGVADRERDRHAVEHARARWWLAAAGEALARGAVRMPDSLPLRALRERFDQELSRRA